MSARIRSLCRALRPASGVGFKGESPVSDAQLLQGHSGPEARRSLYRHDNLDSGGPGVTRKGVRDRHITGLGLLLRFARRLYVKKGRNKEIRPSSRSTIIRRWTLSSTMRSIAACSRAFVRRVTGVGRTGEAFMKLAMPGDIHHLCSPNALLNLQGISGGLRAARY